MPTLEALQRTIISIESLRSVVKTMKALAAVSIRQYERAVVALAEYNQTIELGLQVVLRDQLPMMEMIESPRQHDHCLGVIAFGSDYGMVGQFNEQIAAYTRELIPTIINKQDGCHVVAVGEQATARLEDTNLRIEKTFAVPGSVGGITPLVQDLLVQIEAWQAQYGMNQLILIYNQARSGTLYQPAYVQILPLDQQWLHDLETRPWPSHELPIYIPSWEIVFANLIRQYFFVALYRACTESLTNENASRLAAMQRAEQNIEDHLTEITTLFNQLRQSAITEELLDIISGVEAQGRRAAPIQQ